MKAKNRKIWSIPIAALALVLMLVGALAVSGIVQAQSAPGVPGTMSVVAPANASPVVRFKVSNVPAVDSTTGSSAIQEIVAVVEGEINAAGDAVTTTTDPMLNTSRFTAVFERAAVPEQGVTLTNEMRFDRVGVTASDGLTTGHIYRVKLTSYYDTDITEAAEEDDTTNILEAGPQAVDTEDDRDGSVVTTLTVYVPMVDTPVIFQADVVKVVSGELISRVGRDISTNPMSFVIKNLGPGTAEVNDQENDIDFVLEGSDEVRLRADSNSIQTTRNYDAIITIDRGDFDLNDSADAVNTFTIPISADVDLADGLTFTTEQLDDDDTLGVDNTATAVEGINYSVTIPESAAPGTGVLHYFVHGALPVVDGDAGASDDHFNDIDVEEITGVIGGASAHLFRVNNETMAIEYSGPAGGLSADDDPHVLRITASGDKGLANRLIVGMVKITVADVDSAPANPGPQTATLLENEEDAGLVKNDSLVKDLAGLTSDPEGLDLTYEVVGASDFDFDGSKLMTAAAILDTIISRSPDNPNTVEVETDADWPTGGNDGWSLATTPSMTLYPDMVRKINVKASDGVPSNSQTFEVTITLSLNEPTSLKTDGLPGDVMAAKLMIDDDDDAETVAVEKDGYTLAVSVEDRELVYTLVNLGDLVSDADSDDDLEFKVTSSPSHVVHDASDDDALLLTYLPQGSDTTPRVDVLTVTVSDGFNDADTIDDIIYIELSVTKEAPDPITSEFVGITVAENSLVCMQDGSVGCSLAGQVPTAVSYSIESGVHGGNTDYEVASDGTITVLVMPNYEDGLNPAFLVNARNDLGELAGLVSVRVDIMDVNEPPVIAEIAGTAWVYETAQNEDAVAEAPGTPPVPADTDLPISISAEDPEEDTVTYRISSTKDVPFAVDSTTGALTVSLAQGEELDHETAPEFTFTVEASDGVNNPTMDVNVKIVGSNEAPNFVSPAGDEAVTTIDEDMMYADGPIMFGVAGDISVFNATDEDEDDLSFELREGASRDQFEIAMVNRNDAGDFQAELRVKQDVELDFEAEDYDPDNGLRVHVEVQDPAGLADTLLLIVKLNNVNDESPTFDAAPRLTLTIAENTARGNVLANYAATDADGDEIKYTLEGDDAKSFAISQTGDLLTLESLDSDSGTPCGSDGCSVTVVASDMPGAASGAPTGGHKGPAEANVIITVSGVEDSISTPHITKANPVPGVGMGKSDSALAGLKVIGDEYLWNMLDCPRMLDLVNSSDKSIYCKMWDGLSTKAKGVVSAKLSAPEESPSDLPATYGDEGKGPANFVETEWANWGTVLRIEVTAESPDATCGVDVGVATRNNNQCVELIVKSDSADDVIHLAAYRSNEQENRYVAAVMLVELEAHASNYVLNSGGDEVRTPIYRHQRVRNVVPSAARTDDALQVPRLQVDEEDEIEIEFHNLRADIDVENEPPEISNVSPEHEAAFDDADVEYTFSVSDDNSGLPEPEDLPDTNGDEDYTPVVGLVSDRQCVIDDPDDGLLARAIRIHESEYLYCGDNKQDGEYIANESGWGFAPIRDDRDFDETSDGFDVETTLVLVKNEIFYVTFIACDRAGNCASYDPDGNDDDVELAKITIDTEVPEFVEARTGVKWDSSDNEYGDDRSFIQVIFDDLTPLNEETVEADDFVVQGHTVKAVYIYSPDDEDTLWADENSDGTLNADTDPTRYAKGGPNSEWGDRGALYRKIDRTVFLELEDELLADETPDVTIIPNGVEDQAGNEQDDGDVEAKDWIAPRFVVVSIVAADTPEGASNQLAGDGDEVTVMVTSDERLDQTRPTVTVTYVDASMVDTKGTATCGTDGKRKRGEITMNTAGKTSTDCADNALATGDELNNHIEKITNTEWVVTVTEPKATGYYNFHIMGADRSPKKNEGSEGVGADEIVTEFFDSDGDVNSDDAVFWEADINLPNPNIRVSGEAVTDNEASVEYRSPLFVEIDFTVNHWIRVDCDDVETDDRMANCMNENSEYSEDNFDDVVVTMFQLDGVDMTDSVKTTDSQTFLVSLESVSIGDHTVLIQGMDQAGNILEDTLEIDFEVNDRDPFEKRLSPGWNLVSLPGEPANSNIASVFGSDVEVRTVYTYDPVIPGGWMVAVRETLESDWQGDLTEISGQRGYWVLSDAIQDWEVIIPRLSGGAAGTGTPIQPPVIALYAGWNLIPVIDISGDGEGGDTIDAEVYLQELGDGLDLARVLGFNTIRNQWQTVLDPDMQMNNTLEIGSAYWIFVREAASLVPSGFVGGGGGGD